MAGETATGELRYSYRTGSAAGTDIAAGDIPAMLSGLSAGETVFLDYTFTGTGNYRSDELRGTIAVTVTERPAPVIPPVFTYRITVSDAEGGSVSASRNSAYEGATVYLTVKSADGYVLDTLTVTAADGSAVAVTDKGNGRWTFEMPGANVTVSASFRKDTVFTDIDGHWYTEAINWAVEQGIAVDDEGTGLFRPEDVCTRASMVTFLWRAAGCPEPAIANPVTDVSESDAWYKAALWACEMGITKGYGSKDTFAPEAVSTRAQTVLFLQRAVKAADGSVNSFTDVPAGSYYEGAVSWAAENGITNGTSTGVFSPAADCYRGQIITFLYRLYKDR